MGLAAGVLFGILLTIAAAKHVVDSHEEKLTAQNQKLETENKELKSKLQKETAVEASAEILAGDKEGWALALVNDSHPLATDYVPELTEIDTERSVDKRIAEDLEKMMQDAQDEGLSMYVASAYRSYEQQREVFNTTMQDWIVQGYGPMAVSYTHLDVYKRQAQDADRKYRDVLRYSGQSEITAGRTGHLPEGFETSSGKMCIRDRYARSCAYLN